MSEGGDGSAVSFGKVKEAEEKWIEASRSKRGVEKDGPLVGLAFSGGGIRSATFNLGILQGLAKKGLLQKIDYLSTVSGGGYIGSWLQAWIYRSDKGLKNVEVKLKNEGGTKEAPQIHWLRDYSNYLTPRTGLFSADTWAMAGVYLRNVFLNQTILVLVIAGLLLIPLIVEYVAGKLLESLQRPPIFP